MLKFMWTTKINLVTTGLILVLFRSFSSSTSCHTKWLMQWKQLTDACESLVRVQLHAARLQHVQCHSHSVHPHKHKCCPYQHNTCSALCLLPKLLTMLKKPSGPIGAQSHSCLWWTYSETNLGELSSSLSRLDRAFSEVNSANDKRH